MADDIPEATLDHVPGPGRFIQEDATEDRLAAVLRRVTEEGRGA